MDPDGEFHRWFSKLGEWIAKKFDGDEGPVDDRSDWMLPVEGSSRTKRDTGNWLQRFLGIGSFDQRVNRSLGNLENKLAPENISDDCLELFKTLGIDPADYLAMLGSLNFIDGTESTDTIEDQVNYYYASATKTLGWTVADLFEKIFPDSPPNEMIMGWTPPDGPNVYLRPGPGTSTATVGREIFHKLGLDDTDLLRPEWGLDPKGKSSQFSEYFRKKCL